MPRVDPEVKKKIMDSAAFLYWWDERRKIHPIPKDPFRAFMIDIGIPARLKDPEEWKRRVNRSDYILIDHPSVRTKIHQLKQMAKQKKQKQKETLQIEKIKQMLIKSAVEFTKQHGVPMPQFLRFDISKGWTRSFFKGTYHGEKLIASVNVGIKGKNPLLMKSAMLHELGHYIDYLKRPPRVIVAPSRSVLKMSREREAWKYARKFLTHPVQTWSMAMSLKGYRDLYEQSILGEPMKIWIWKTEAKTREAALGVKRLYERQGRKVKVEVHKGKPFPYQIYVLAR